MPVPVRPERAPDDGRHHHFEMSTSHAPTTADSILSPPPAQILIVDDHPIYRRGLVALVDTDPALSACAEASNLREALQMLRDHKPDAVIVDISLPGPDGLEVIKAMLAERPRLPILVVSMHHESVYAFRALRAGALGYVMKSDLSARVHDALHDVLHGRLHVSSAFRDQLIFKAIDADRSREFSPLDNLSQRETEVLELIGRGLGTRDIAASLGLSPKTVETHRARVKEKLRIGDSGELVRFAVEWVNRETE